VTLPSRLSLIKSEIPIFAGAGAGVAVTVAVSERGSVIDEFARRSKALYSERLRSNGT